MLKSNWNIYNSKMNTIKYQEPSIVKANNYLPLS